MRELRASARSGVLKLATSPAHAASNSEICKPAIDAWTAAAREQRVKVMQTTVSAAKASANRPIPVPGLER